MKRKLLIISIIMFLISTSALFADEVKSVSFIVTGNVRAEFNLCG